MADSRLNRTYYFPCLDSKDGPNNEINLAQTQNERLRKMCVAYRLKPKEKRRKYYEQALEAFSLNQDAWESWRNGNNVRAHKGPRSGVAPGALGASRNLNSTSSPVRKDGKERLLKWAQSFQKALDEDTTKYSPHSPSLSKKIYDVLNEMEMLGLVNRPHLDQDSPGKIAQIALLELVKSLADHTSTSNHTFTTPKDGPHPVQNLSVSSRLAGDDQDSRKPELKLLSPYISAPLAHTNPILPAHDVLTTPQVGPPLSRNPQSPGERHCLVLARSILLYSENDLPDYVPTGIALLAEDLDVLWDDARPHWRGTSPLVIKSVPIALKYWPCIHWPPPVWATVSKTWNRWKVLITEYHRLGSESFSAMWSQGGTLQSSSRIIQTLVTLGQKEDFELASTARREFGDTFPQYFSYQKGGQTHVCSTPSSIARRYRKLKHIPHELI